MFDLHEMFKIMNELTQESEKPEVISVTVNNRTFKSYSEAENYIRELIFKESF